MTTETFSEMLGFVLSLAFLGYAIYAFSSIILESSKYIKDEIRLFFLNKGSGSLKEDYEKYLNGKFAYYDRLPGKLKVKFLLRVRSFISSREFYGRGELEVTDEMKVLVAASAVQLTFGLEKYRFDYFSKIILYPESYYSKLDDNYHMGETNAMGILVFSWKDLREGYAISSDAFNVGLHEMAHALELEQHLGDDYDFYFASYFEKWSLITKEEFQNVYDERESFLRQYAGTNRQEFFAVCIEYFFEKSEEFKQRLPEIYYHLSALLNQDPLAADGSVTELPFPDQNTMLAEVQSSFPIFTSRYFIFDFDFFLYLAFVFFMCYISFSASAARLDLFFFMVLILTAFFLIGLFFKLNRLLVYDNYLAVKNPFGKIKCIYPLSRILSVNFLSGRNLDSVTLLLPSRGRILKYMHRYKMSDKDLNTLTALLREKKVLVKD